MSKIEKETFCPIRYFFYCKYARMVPVFQNRFKNRATNIIRNRVTFSIFRYCKTWDNIEEESIENRNCLMFVRNNVAVAYQSDQNDFFSRQYIFSDKNGLTVSQKAVLSDIFLTFRCNNTLFLSFLESETQQFHCFAYFHLFSSLLICNTSKLFSFNYFLRESLIYKRQMISPRIFLFTRCMLF